MTVGQRLNEVGGHRTLARLIRVSGVLIAGTLIAGALALSGLLATTASAQAPFAPEPTGLGPGPMQGATPRTLKGATVIDAETFKTLVTTEHPVLVDVANKEHRPDDRPDGLDWTPVHRSVPGATWLPGAGTGHDAPGFADAFARRMAEATGGDKAKPVIAFCHAQRWGSWNVAKRLTDLGYTHVYWYPGGSEGWGTVAPMRAVVEDPRWRAAGFDKSSAGDRPDGQRPVAK